MPVSLVWQAAPLALVVAVLALAARRRPGGLRRRPRAAPPRPATVLGFGAVAAIAHQWSANAALVGVTTVLVAALAAAIVTVQRLAVHVVRTRLRPALPRAVLVSASRGAAFATVIELVTAHRDVAVGVAGAVAWAALDLAFFASAEDRIGPGRPGAAAEG